MSNRSPNRQPRKERQNVAGEAWFDMLARVKATPGTLQQGGASFATTHWSVVAQSALTNIPEAENALAQLCERYWPPIYSFVRRRVYSPADAQDLTQSFFTFFLRTKAYARTDRLHGKFCSFPACIGKKLPVGQLGPGASNPARRRLSIRFTRPGNGRSILRRIQRVRFNGGTFIQITLGKIAHSRRPEFIARRIAGRRQAQTFRTTKELSYWRHRSAFVR